MWGDSEISRRAIAANAERLGLPPVPWTPVTSPPPEDADVVVIRLPRSLRRLQHLLAELAPALHPGTRVLLGAKTRLVQKSTVAAVDAAIGPASSTRARYRARLIVATADGREAPRPPPRTYEIGPGLVVHGLPGVFGEERLDRGTKLLLGCDLTGSSIVDLGCGAGPLAIAAAAANPTASITCCDESHLAVASARRTLAEVGFGARSTFHVTDVLDGVADASADLVVCNPPFHQGDAVTRRVAAHMFVESRRVLVPGGRLLVVGNRHLGYHTRLRQLFGSADIVRSDPKFVVLEARR